MGFEYRPWSCWDQPFLEALIDDHLRGLSNIESSVEELFWHVQVLLSKIYDCVDISTKPRMEGLCCLKKNFDLRSGKALCTVKLGRNTFSQIFCVYTCTCARFGHVWQLAKPPSYCSPGQSRTSWLRSHSNALKHSLVVFPTLQNKWDVLWEFEGLWVRCTQYILIGNS